MSNRTWKRPKHPVRRNRSRRDRVVGSVILGTVVLGVSAVIAVGLATNGSSSHQAGAGTATTSTTKPLTPQQRQAVAWKAAVSKDFSPLASVLQPLLTDEQSWISGSGTAATVLGDIQRFLPDFQLTQANLAKQAPLALAPGALSGYRMAARLYYEATVVTSQAASLPAGPLVHQVQLIGVRLRELGDRVFDEAGTEVDKFGPPAQQVSGVTVIPPADVPLWTSVNLAAGPPLAPQPVATPPVTYQTSRPQEAFATWRQQVTSSGIPPASTEASAILTGTAAQLASLSDSFQSAVNQLTADPDPSGARSEGTRLRLDLLVDAEASRLAEAAALSGSTAPGTQLRQIAQAVAAIGDQLWDARLGPRSTGFPQSLLTS